MITTTIQLKTHKIPKLRFSGFVGEWEEKKLGEVGKIVTGNTPDTSVLEYYNGKRLFVSPVDIQDNRYVRNTKTRLTELGFSQGREVKKSSTFFVCIGSTIGKVAQAFEECITNQQINTIESNDNFSNDFIYSLLGYKASRIKLLAGKQAVPIINKTDFSKLKLPFPKKEEQQKIAGFLGVVDEKIEQLKSKKLALEKYKKGIMQKIFSQEIRFKPARMTKSGGDENGKDYPDWEEKKLGEVAKFFSGGTPTSTNKKYYSGNIPFIKSGEILKNNTEQFVTKEAINESSAKMVEKGDLLYALYGATSGTVAISQIDGAVNQAVLCIRTNNDKNWLFNFLNYNKGRILAKYLQGGQGNLSTDIIKNLKIISPSLQEQQKIALFLSSLDSKVENINKELTSTQKFKKGLLQGLFV